MHDLSSYPGEELVLFEKAVNWKRYWSSFVLPHIGTRVAEAGAGLGANTLILYRNNTDQWLLLEPDTAMAAMLEKKLATNELPARCRVIHGTLSSLGLAPQFDTIIYIDVLEHIEDDKAEIATAAGLLMHGGKLVILSPAFPSLYSPFDKAIGHYRRYTKRTLKDVIPASLKAVSIRYLDSTGFLMSMINRMFLKQKYPTQKQVNFWDRVGIAISRITDRLLFFSFGKTILGVWEKL
jgi:SAM-dependent methyltransferase